MATIGDELELEPAGDEDLHVCHVCAGTFPRDEMAVGTRRGSVLRTCVGCREHQQMTRPGQSERERRTAARRSLGWVEVDHAPSPAPARQLRELLALERERGTAPTIAWRRCVPQVLSEIRDPRDKADWRDEVLPFAEPWFLDAYQGIGHRLQLGPALVAADADGAGGDLSILS